MSASSIAYLTGSLGPQPYPKKPPVPYQRLFSIAGDTSDTAHLNLTLGSLAGVHEKENKVL